MNLHQFRFVQEAVRRGLNLTETAKALHTSQPGISKAILDLEDELGVDIFVRHGKRLRRLTEPGQQVLAAVEIIMREVDNLRQIGDEYRLQDAGSLVIAATSSAAHYILPTALAQLRKRLPKVRVRVIEGDVDLGLRLLRADAADLAVLCAPVAGSDLVTLPFGAWQPMLLLPIAHPLASEELVTLERLAAEPLLTYSRGASGRDLLDVACAQRGLKPTIALETTDSALVARYVEQGMGLGIVNELALATDSVPPHLATRSLAHLLGHGQKVVVIKRGAYLRNYVYAFAETLSEHLTRAAITQALAEPSAQT